MFRFYSKSFITSNWSTSDCCVEIIFGIWMKKIDFFFFFLELKRIVFCFLKKKWFISGVVGIGWCLFMGCSCCCWCWNASTKKIYFFSKIFNFNSLLMLFFYQDQQCNSIVYWCVCNGFEWCCYCNSKYFFSNQHLFFTILII